MEPGPNILGARVQRELAQSHASLSLAHRRNGALAGFAGQSARSRQYLYQAALPRPQKQETATSRSARAAARSKALADKRRSATALEAVEQAAQGPEMSGWNWARDR